MIIRNSWNSPYFFVEDKIKMVLVSRPRNISHVRWMAKVIYALEIALFREQLKDHIEAPIFRLTQIKELAIFYSLYYIKEWFTCPSPFNVPLNDLNLYNKLHAQISEKYISEKYSSFTSAVLSYLSERLLCCLSSLIMWIKQRKMLWVEIIESIRNIFRIPSRGINRCPLSISFQN